MAGASVRARTRARSGPNGPVHGRRANRHDVAAGERSLVGRRKADSELRTEGNARSAAATPALNSMDVNEDFVDIAKGFIDNGVEFLVVGAYALDAHGFPRTTGDIDMLVRPSPENAARVFRALAEFGVRVAAHGVSQHDFEVEDKVYQLGLPPRRID